MGGKSGFEPVVALFCLFIAIIMFLPSPQLIVRASSSDFHSLASCRCIDADAVSLPNPPATTSKNSQPLTASSGQEPVRPYNTVTIQPGPEGKDATIFCPETAYHNYNSGAEQIIQINRPEFSNKMLLQFDLSSIPAGSKINSATLYAYCYNTWEEANFYTPDSVTASLYRILHTWTEGSGDRTLNPLSYDGVDWFNYTYTTPGNKLTGVSWITWGLGSGFDYAPSAYASSVINGRYNWYSWSIKSLVQEWVFGTYSNYGIVIFGTGYTGQAAWRGFRSSDYTTASDRPYLVVDYTDFTVSASPPSQAVAQGQGTSYTVDLTALYNYNDWVTLSCSGLPSGATYSFTTNPVKPTGSSTLQVNTQDTTPTGDYTLTIQGADGTLTHSTTVTLKVQGFSISAIPGSRTINQGQSTDFTVSLTSLNGYSSAVTLSCSGQPSGVTISFGSNPLPTPGNTLMTVDTLASTIPGDYTLTIQGADGYSTRSTTVTLRIQGFSISASPLSQSVVQGQSVDYTVTVTSLNGYTNSVFPSCSGLPAGATVGFNPAQLNPPVQSTMTVTTIATTPTGTFILTITGTDGSLSHTTNVDLVVVGQDFTIAASPPSQTIDHGQSIDFTVDLSSLYGYSNAVTLSCSGQPSGATVSFNPNPQIPTGQSIMTVSTLNTTVPGDYTLTITGTDGTLTHSTTVVLSIQGFSISALPPSNSTVQGGSVNYTVILTSLNGYNKPVTLSCSGLPTGATPAFNVTQVTPTGNANMAVSTQPTTPMGTYNLTIRGTNGTLNHTKNVTLVITGQQDFTISASPPSGTISQGQSIDYTVDLTSLNGYSGTVTLSCSGFPSGATYSFVPAQVSPTGQSTLTVDTQTTTAPGDYTLTITGTDGTLTHTTTVLLKIQGFSISATPPSQTVIQGQSADYTITLTSLNGYTNPVTLTCTGLPIGASAGFNPNPVTPTGTSTMTVTTSATTPTGSFTLTVTGSDGSLSHSATVGLTVDPLPPDFTISASPPTRTIFQGQSTTYTVNLGSLNGYSQSVGLSCTGQPSGATPTFNPSSVTPPGTSTLTIATAPTVNTGTFTLTITGTDGTLTHTATVSLTINPLPDFNISASPKTQTIVQGQSATYAVSLDSFNGYSQSVSLCCKGLPSGATPSFTPPSVTPPGTSTLTISTTSSVGTGTYQLTLEGNDSVIVHQVTVTLIVQQAPVLDFSISASPQARTINQSESAAFKVDLTSINGYSKSVSLSCTGLPSGATPSFNPSSVIPTGSSTLTITTTPTVTTGSFSLTIKGTEGSLTHSTGVTLNINAKPDFNVTALPKNQNVNQGQSVDYTVAVNATGSYSSIVSLSCLNLPSGTSASFSPQKVTPTGTSKMTISVAVTAQTGTYTLTVKGTNSSLTRTTTVSLTIQKSNAPDFSMTVDPGTGEVVKGENAVFNISVSSVYGYSSKVTLSISGLPKNATAAFSPLSLTPGNGSTLTITTTSLTDTGSFLLTIAGANGTLSHSAQATLVVKSPANLRPVCAISYPSDNATVSGSITVKGTASDPDGKVLKVEVRIDGGNWVTVAGTEDWSYVLDTNALSNGNHDIYVRAYDGTAFSDIEKVTFAVANGEGAGFMIVGIIGVIIAIVVVILLLLLLAKRRKKKETERDHRGTHPSLLPKPPSAKPPEHPGTVPPPVFGGIRPGSGIPEEEELEELVPIDEDDIGKTKQVEQKGSGKGEAICPHCGMSNDAGDKACFWCDKPLPTPQRSRNS